ncbi:hypothetical protein ACFXHA_33275 [Nocardia sp. NPDC059240]|uniref:hypothetical protein n=1 Tax=Nocardia sp. NPDC059240 TaxID=3346786 RepID=UPI0036835534
MPAIAAAYSESRERDAITTVGEDVETCIIHVRRERDVQLFHRHVHVMIDGRSAGQVAHLATTSLPIPAGTHKVQIRCGEGSSAVVAVTIAPGQEITFSTRFRVLTWMHSWSLEQVTAPIPAAAPPLPTDLQILEVIEAQRTEEPMGDETRTIDNRTGAANVVRVVRASREWSHTITFGTDRSRRTNNEFGFGPQWASVKHTIETALRDTYSNSSDFRESHSEEITVNVPAGSCIQLVLHWKRILQRGTVRVQRGRRVVEVPFQTVVGVTFDQVQRQLA